ncbi:MAG: ABC transporter ATP-binding protein [Gemmatimonadales bacterium]|nr:ABC transporter ATP-binding protein [Gemmatimonadales bacterium]
MTIEIKDLAKTFGKKEAVKGFNLTVPKGSFFGFLGPNGAGKTTTIRMVTGLLAPTRGDAILAGNSIVRNAVAAKRQIGVVPDDLALFDRLSMWEHLTMAGGIYGLNRDDTHTRAEDLLKVMGLWEERGTFAGDSSHGMRKKLALAMALIHNPSILFLDEPFEGIDPLAGKVLRRLLQRMSEQGTTIFLTSHILEIIEKLVDHVAIIVEGEIALDSSLAELVAGGRTLEDVFVDAVGDSAGDSDLDLAWL